MSNTSPRNLAIPRRTSWAGKAFRLFLCINIVLPAPAWAEIELIGRTTVPADAADRSGLKGLLEGDVPQDRLGGFSAIAYTGKGNRYAVLPDRGPADGATSYPCRFHLADLCLDEKGKLEFQLVSTTMLHDRLKQPFVGSLKAFTKGKGDIPLRLDPEGLAFSPRQTMFVAEEYGPHLLEFSLNGQMLHSLPVPSRFLIDHPQDDAKLEAEKNPKGRFPNRGFEGLTMSADGKKLYAIMQGPLIQDGGREGLHARLVEFTLADGKTREFVYPMENIQCGLNEILAINDREFLVIERDGDVGKARRTLKIQRIDISQATDVRGVDSLPKEGLPAGITPLQKTTFLDMLNPRFGLAAAELPEKVEGLTFGPTLADGRRLLIVCSDNDFADVATHIWAFAIDSSDLN